MLKKVIQYNDASYEDLEHAWKEQKQYLQSFSYFAKTMGEIGDITAEFAKDVVKESVHDMKESIKKKASLVINKIRGNDGLSR